jgi:hypothetical protein
MRTLSKIAILVGSFNVFIGISCFFAKAPISAVSNLAIGCCMFVLAWSGKDFDKQESASVEA